MVIKQPVEKAGEELDFVGKRLCHGSNLTLTTSLSAMLAGASPAILGLQDFRC
jgi:hypothetical protein